MSLPVLLHELQARSTDVLTHSTLNEYSIEVSINNASNVTAGMLEVKNIQLRVVVAVVSLLSMIGAVLIILSYICISSVRTKVREILVHLSVADFGVACANFIGVTVDFDHYIKSCYNSDGVSCVNLMNLCMTQAFFAGFSTIASILWTLALSVYIYLLVVHGKLHSKVVYFCYVFCWGMPLLISLWLVLTGKLHAGMYIVIHCMIIVRGNVQFQYRIGKAVSPVCFLDEVTACSFHTSNSIVIVHLSCSTDAAV